MTCTAPLAGYRNRDGTVGFGRNTGSSLIKLAVACGQCIGCRIDKSEQWATRICHELQITEATGKSSYFLTLTYDDKHLPTNQSLQPRDWQLFAKRLRKHYGSFRFYHCGEYGDTTQRPHYHAIIFGVDLTDLIPLKKNAQGQMLFLSPKLAQIWGKGHVTLGSVTPASARYVASYTLKRITGPNAASHYNGRHPEYSTMSRKPGIGSRWLQRYQSDIYPSDETVREGKRVKTPRYYDEQIKLTQPEIMEQIKSRRKSKALKHKLTDEQLQARSEILKQRTGKHTL